MATESTAAGEWALLTAHLPGLPVLAIGVLLRDIERDKLHIRLRTDWTCFALNGNAQIFEQIAEDLTGKAWEEGAMRVLDWLDDTLSHAIRISARRSLEVIDFATALDELYRKHVGGRERQP